MTGIPLGKCDWRKVAKGDVTTEWSGCSGSLSATVIPLSGQIPFTHLTSIVGFKAGDLT